MNHTTENGEKKSRKKLWAVVGVGALAVGLAGGGALTTLYTSITGNDFRTAVPEEYDEDRPETETEGALLTIAGDPMVHEFDSSTHNDLVQASWTLTNEGKAAAPFDGTFVPVGAISPELAAALTVEYGVHGADGAIQGWVPAGTLADQVSYAEALNLGDSTIAGGEERPIAVRVVLPDPRVLADDENIGAELRVVANFTVSYIDPLDRTA